MTLELPDFNSFDSTVAALFSRVRGHIEPGAHRLLRLLPPESLLTLYQIPSILVSGTNGKGTTCALLEQCFRDSGYHTALYTSPHIVSPTERIRLNGMPIAEELFLKTVRKIFDYAKSRLNDATFFELMTAIAFEIFTQIKPDILVCEVGLGGRLDSTNILNPLVSILTSVGLDHTEWLVNTDEKIAYEKAFISRRNRPFIIAPVSKSAKIGIQKALCTTGALPLWVECTQEYQQALDEVVQLALSRVNIAGGPAVEPLKFANSKRRFFWPGRFDLRSHQGIRILFDAAHNAHGVNYFIDLCYQPHNLERIPKPWILVFASLSDKDWQQSLKALASHFGEIHCTQTMSPRAVNADELLNYVKSEEPNCVVLGHGACTDALAASIESSKSHKGTLFILGSITLIGEAMEILSIPVFPDIDQVKQ